MPNDALDSKFPLRMTKAERAVVEAVQADAIEAGISASLNDVIRHLVRRAQMTPPRSEAAARAAIIAHWDTCPDCDATTKPLCLDGLHLQRSYAPFARTPAPNRAVGSQRECAA